MKMTLSTRRSKQRGSQRALTVGVALVAVLAAVWVAGCSAIIEKKLGDGEDVCGDGVRGPTEECEGMDFGGQDCKTYNGQNATGDLVCDGNCTIDSQYCMGGEDCDNGICEPGEFADGCTVDCWDGDCNDGYCQYWESVDFCPGDCGGPIDCGNGVREHGEECDGDDFGSATCESVGFGPGTLICAGDCMIMEAECAGAGICGDGFAGLDEDCDGDDLRGLTCVDLGYVSGSLSCDAGCRFADLLCASNGEGYDGDACVDASDCRGSECLHNTHNGGIPYSYCSHVCQFGICPGGGVCIEGPAAEAPLCYLWCDDLAPDCQSGFECLSVVADETTEFICWPENPD
jgi:hypothetical protein